MTGGVNYVSNMFKSTFRADSLDKEKDCAFESTDEPAAAGEPSAPKKGEPSPADQALPAASYGK